MTISPWLIYLWGISDQMLNVANFLSIACGVIGAIIGVIALIATSVSEECSTSRMMDEPTGKRWFTGAKRLLVASGIFTLVYMLTPSSKTIAVMVILPAIVNSEPIQKDLPDLYRIAVDALKKELSGEPEKK